MASAAERFEKLFGRAPTHGARAPGRVNLIGEHVDYLGGVVMPAAINRATSVHLAPNGSGRFSFHSREHPRASPIEVEADPGDWRERTDWTRYILGVLDAFAREGIETPPMDFMIESDVPPSAGLSSSAALEVAAAWAINDALRTEFGAARIAGLAYRAETEFVGVPCGIMDQMVSACARPGHALRIDCETGETSHVPIDQGVTFIVAHSGVERDLASGGVYATRRIECERAFKRIIELSPSAGYRTLCRVPPEEFALLKDRIERPDNQRSHYVIEETARVVEFERRIAARDYAGAGRAMNATHEGLRELFEVSCPELDALAQIARDCPGVFGARMTGAGLGGCIVVMVEATRAAEVIDTIIARHPLRGRIEPLVFATRPMGGARSLEL